MIGIGETAPLHELPSVEPAVQLVDLEHRDKAIIPIEDVCRDYFSHLNPTKLVQKISAGEIAIPLVRMEASQKCAKGIHLLDLAKYLDARVEVARKEMAALTT
ncbi:pyocin activator PrtN family protein [Bradyrhizobium sp. NC92]|uniref:pyocin activator PrtN family protein n=1 Tax=Bradyrhizobium sp. (strain NC92) TaxID=55395 RepID=UPI0021A9EEAA|nr:pyocin activator PrtN family protein [Bradyrhizobium sp. NC92]UWU70563.1 pyocin activator PrtN family protein [Bradyrhizobium sp. NC92]